MQFKSRDKVVVNRDGYYVEGFVHQIDEDGVLYVVLSGQNQQLEAVLPKQCLLLTDETQKLLAAQVPKRKRGRPKKVKQ